MSDEMCPNPVTCPFVDSTEPHPVSDHPGMSDRRPSKLWTKDGDGWFVATPDEVLAAVRRQVESGTIKGEVRRYCTEHEALVGAIPHLCNVANWVIDGGGSPTDCRINDALVVSDGGSET